MWEFSLEIFKEWFSAQHDSINSSVTKNLIKIYIYVYISVYTLDKEFSVIFIYRGRELPNT